MRRGSGERGARTLGSGEPGARAPGPEERHRGTTGDDSGATGGGSGPPPEADLLAAVDPDLLARLRGRRVALVHDWLTGMRGGERVLEVFCRIFPDAEIFTLLHVSGTVSELIESRSIHTSFVQRLPGAARAYRWYLPLFPWAIEALDLDGFDLVLSSSHCAAKAAVPPPASRHVCYCHTPMRYAWDQFDAYFGRERVGRARHALFAATLAWLRRWDRATAERVDAFVANSRWVAGRIGAYYGRSAEVIPPPVNTDWFQPADAATGRSGETGHPRRSPPQDTEPFPGAGPDGAAPGDYHLVVSALNPYKRIDVAIEAFNRTGRHLRVVGTGPEEARLRRLAGPTVDLLGRVGEERLRELYRGCRALILPAVEDAGIVPLEAMACGRPAIVLDRGGAAETVQDGRTGILMPESTPEALIEAVDRAESVTFNTSELRSRALRNGSDVFAHRIVAFVARVLGETSASPGERPTSDGTIHVDRTGTEADTRSLRRNHGRDGTPADGRGGQEPGPDPGTRPPGAGSPDSEEEEPSA